MKKYLCPCCGFVGLDVPPYSNYRENSLIRNQNPPYGILFGEGSYEVCGCCGFEFGFDDYPGPHVPPVSFEEYLQEWVDQGGKWFDESQRPEGWRLEQQLEKAIRK